MKTIIIELILRYYFLLITCTLLLISVRCNKDKCTNPIVGNYALTYVYMSVDSSWQHVPYYTGTDYNHDKEGTISGELGISCDYITIKEVSGMYEWGFWGTYTWYLANNNPYEIINDTSFKYYRKAWNRWDTATNKLTGNTVIIELEGRKYFKK